MTTVNRPTSRHHIRTRRGSLHSVDGLPSSLNRKHLETMSRSELLELKERNERMLRHKAVIHTLPDKGAKIKQSIKQIDSLLLGNLIRDDIITPENTHCDRESLLTDKLAAMTFLAPRQEARRQSIARANTYANSNGNMPAAGTAVPATTMAANRYHYQYPGFLSLPANSPMMTTATINASPPAKVCMMSLDESVKLQQDRLQLMGNKRGPLSVEDSLSMTMGQMQLDPQQQIATLQEDDDDDEEDVYDYTDLMSRSPCHNDSDEDDYCRDYADHDED